MKKRTITLSLLLISVFTFSQSWEWAKSNGGNGIENGSFITADSEGNTIVIGEFNSSSIVFGNDTLTNLGFYDTYITKNDATGNVSWAKSIGGNGRVFPTSICTDNSNNIIVTGHFNSPQITIGSNTLNNNTDTTTNDVFVVAFDSIGNYLWGKVIGGINNEYSYGVISDTNDNIYIGGYYDTDTLSFENDTLTNNGGDDIFVCKFDASGNEIWARGYGGTGDDNVRGIEVDTNDDVILIGEFDSPTLLFDSNSLSNVGDFDLFITKISSTGLVVWTNEYGGDRDDKSISVSTDSLGNIFVTGFFLSDTLSFNSFTLSGAHPGNGEIWLTKYDLDGNVIWAVDNGGDLFDKGIGVINDGQGGAFITGYFISDSLTFGETTVTNNGSETRDFYIAKYDTDGVPQWANSAGGVAQDFGFSLCRFENNIYITGKFESSSIVIGATTLTNTNSATTTSDMFISKLSFPSTLGVSDNINRTIIAQVYPNPTAGTLNLNFGKQIGVTIRIVNVIGKIVYKKEVYTNFYSINLNIPKGIYFVEIINKGNIQVSKLIVE